MLAKESQERQLKLVTQAHSPLQLYRSRQKCWQLPPPTIHLTLIGTTSSVDWRKVMLTEPRNQAHFEDDSTIRRDSVRCNSPLPPKYRGEKNVWRTRDIFTCSQNPFSCSPAWQSHFLRKPPPTGTSTSSLMCPGWGKGWGTLTSSQMRAELASDRMESRAGPGFSRVVSGWSVSARRPHHLHLERWPGWNLGSKACGGSGPLRTEAVTGSGGTK